MSDPEFNTSDAAAALDGEIVGEFLVESYENLDQLDRDLVALEQDPASEPTLSSIFRTVHTIKGTCGFLGFAKLECVSHVGENLLSKLRDGELQLQPDITTALLRLVDAIREILANIETVGAEGEADYSELLQTLIALQGGPLEEAFAVTSLDDPTARPAAEAEVASPAGIAAQALSGETATAEQFAAGQIDSLQQPGPVDDSRHGTALDGTIRVDVGLLDKLMNRVGELVLARNQILQFTSATSDVGLLGAAQRLNLITTELQEGVMKTRMQPIGNVWSKFPRVVRDLALQCGKQVRIEMEGQETELDKTIVEAIKDPLTHVVRNAIDHGIETAAERRAAGKPAEGCLRLRAFHEGGQVNIEISDDGHGLNFDRIRRKAVEGGLLTSDQAARLAVRDVGMLIFAPGFSTAAQVTHISGRGVGMDVVKTNIERIGGTVDIHSRPGQGTTIKLKIPLTLAIIPALIVTCGGDRYAIAQASLLELVRLEGEAAQRGIERLHGAAVFRLRGQLLPIVHLRRELRLDLAAATPDILNIVVLRAGERSFGLVVDSINDTEEIVVKPLSPQLKGIAVYAGATIMGDGEGALILDVLGTAQQAGVISEVRNRTLADRAARQVDAIAAPQRLLIVEVSDRRLALPIGLVSRLEEISPERIEKADGREVVQYRGQIVPVVRLGQLLDVATPGPADRPLQVVVYRLEDRTVALVVDRIADIAELPAEAEAQTVQDEPITSVVIQQRVTEVVNLPALIGRAKHSAPISRAATEGFCA